MEWMWLLLAALAGASLVFLVWHYEERTNRTKLRRHVVVNLTTGRSFRGVLWCKHSDWLVLRNGEMLEGREHVPVDGEIVVERRLVEFVQVV